MEKNNTKSDISVKVILIKNEEKATKKAVNKAISLLNNLLVIRKDNNIRSVPGINAQNLDANVV